MPRSAKTAAKRSKKKPQAPTPLPEWLTETPIETEYKLSMHEGGVDTHECQAIELSRMEYLLFKVYLAKLRGFVLSYIESPGLQRQRPRASKVMGRIDSRTNRRRTRGHPCQLKPELLSLSTRWATRRNNCRRRNIEIFETC